MPQWKGELTAAILAVNVCFFSLATYAGWPSWWLHINYERSARAWFFCGQLSAIAFASLLTFYLSRLRSPADGRRFLWFILGVGFLYLAVDKGLQIHERLRDRVLIPHHIATQMAGLHPGDIVLFAYAALGLPLAWKIGVSFPDLRRERFWLLGSVILAFLSLLLDAGDLGSSDILLLRKAQFFEKWLQGASQMCLLVFLVRYNVDLMSELFDGRA
jgi:hypothetical protein